VTHRRRSGQAAGRPAARPKLAAHATIDPKFAPVAAAFARDPRVSRRRMFSSSNVLSVDGKIFAMLSRGKFVAKLPQDRVDALVRSGAGERFDAGRGRPMKEWIAVGAGRADWIALAKEAYRFARRGGTG
jgi:hypothetical protein